MRSAGQESNINLPNVLTLVRILAIPVFVMLLLDPTRIDPWQPRWCSSSQQSRTAAGRHMSPEPARSETRTRAPPMENTACRRGQSPRCKDGSATEDQGNRNPTPRPAGQPFARPAEQVSWKRRRPDTNGEPP